MSFEFSCRVSVSSTEISAIRQTVRSQCASATVCNELRRSHDCACYPEFASRYWLRLGGFPAVHTDLTSLGISYHDPSHADGVAKFLSSPETARTRGWSALIVGPRGSGKTALLTALAKSVMKWELVNAYSTLLTRAIYFTSRDYTNWLRKLDDFRRTPEEVDYHKGAIGGAVLAIDDITPELARNEKFNADIKSRVDKGLPTYLVIAEDIAAYAGTPLFETIGLEIQNDGAYIGPFTKAWGITHLHSRVMTQAGWV
jgi:hypothetical protein